MRLKPILITCMVMGIASIDAFSQESVKTGNVKKTKDKDSVQYFSGPALSIGDPAPELKYSKWLKGKPVTLKGSDKVYLLEFWATWCGPCIEAMPHLSAIAKAYEKNVVVIGANVRENTGYKSYESSLPKVAKFVTNNGDNMNYNVIADNNSLDLLNNWLIPAKVTSIPSTFIIKDGKIVWIGHPYFIENVLDSIIDGTFDVAGFKVKYEEQIRAKKEKKRKAS